MSIHIIGITGQSGAGKTLLTEMLRTKGIPCVNADALYHEMLLPPSRCLERIAEVFGTHLLCEDGTLNRAALASIVFQNPEQLALLNKTVLPLVIDRIRSLIKNAEICGAHYIAVDAPTLIESNFYLECDTVIAVVASDEVRIKRIMVRDKLTEEKARERVSAQPPGHFYTDHAHRIIENDADEGSFIHTAEQVIQQILQEE